MNQQVENRAAHPDPPCATALIVTLQCPPPLDMSQNPSSNPSTRVQESKQPMYLSPYDLAMLSAHYIQMGLLFTKPPLFNVHLFLESLKQSLSVALIHFYPLAGQLVTKNDEDQHSCLIFVDCSKGDGARFIHATSNMTINDILSPIDVPLVVQSLFDHDRAVNHDAHVRPLLSIQPSR
ncbi:hypothetical protein Ancab_016414 [Ancistrocladus abbreviatus]